MVQLFNNLIFVTAYQYLDCVLSHWQLANMFQTVSVKICLVQRDERIIYLFFFFIFFPDLYFFFLMPPFQLFLLLSFYSTEAVLDAVMHQSQSQTSP